MTPRSPHLMLTPRERDVIRGIVAGRTNRELARELGLNEQSVKNVLSIVYSKSGQPVCGIGFIEDISERFVMEDALRRSELRYRHRHWTGRGQRDGRRNLRRFGRRRRGRRRSWRPLAEV